MFLGVDWGKKRMGLAYSSGDIAAPLKVLRVTNPSEAIADIASVCKELGIDKLVIGVPLDADGSETEQSKEIREFGKELKKRVGVEVAFWNEALTSKQALRGKIKSGQGKKRRESLDATAAAYVLQNYLDSHRAA